MLKKGTVRVIENYPSMCHYRFPTFTLKLGKLQQHFLDSYMWIFTVFTLLLLTIVRGCES